MGGTPIVSIRRPRFPARTGADGTNACPSSRKSRARSCCPSSTHQTSAGRRSRRRSGGCWRTPVGESALTRARRTARGADPRSRRRRVLERVGDRLEQVDRDDHARAAARRTPRRRHATLARPLPPPRRRRDGRSSPGHEHRPARARARHHKSPRPRSRRRPAPSSSAGTFRGVRATCRRPARRPARRGRGAVRARARSPYTRVTGEPAASRAERHGVQRGLGVRPTTRVRRPRRGRSISLCIPRAPTRRAVADDAEHGHRGPEQQQQPSARAPRAGASASQRPTRRMPGSDRSRWTAAARTRRNSRAIASAKSRRVATAPKQRACRSSWRRRSSRALPSRMKPSTAGAMAAITSSRYLRRVETVWRQRNANTPIARDAPPRHGAGVAKHRRSRRRASASARSGRAGAMPVASSRANASTRPPPIAAAAANPAALDGRPQVEQQQRRDLGEEREGELRARSRRLVARGLAPMARAVREGQQCGKAGIGSWRHVIRTDGRRYMSKSPRRDSARASVPGGDQACSTLNLPTSDCTARLLAEVAGGGRQLLRSARRSTASPRP